MRLVAGTDVSEMVGAVWFLLCVRDPSIWIQDAGQTFVGLIRIELFI